jgi:hypothetical protein
LAEEEAIRKAQEERRIA